MVSQPAPLLADRLALPRLVHEDLLPPALLTAKPLVTSIHVDVLVRAELPPAQGAGLEEAARNGVAPCRGGGTRRPDHLLQDYVRRVRVPAVVVVAVVSAVLMVHEDLETDDEALAHAHAPAAAADHGRPDQAAAVVLSATLLPEMEDALASWKHGHGGPEVGEG